MAEQVLKNANVVIDGFDVSGKMNAIALDYGAEIKDQTTFGNTSRRKIAGLKSLVWSHQGLWQGGDDDIDDILFARVGSEIVMTVADDGIAEGDNAFINKALLGNYNPGASVGEVFQFSVEGESESEFVSGTVLINATKTVSGNATARELGAVSATQKVYAALHITAIAGTPTLDVIVQSDDGSGFPSPEDRITFNQASAVGAQWGTPLAGVIDDTWWRINYTIGGGSPSLTFIVVVGIK